MSLLAIHCVSSLPKAKFVMLCSEWCVPHFFDQTVNGKAELLFRDGAEKVSATPAFLSSVQLLDRHRAYLYELSNTRDLVIVVNTIYSQADSVGVLKTLKVETAVDLGAVLKKAYAKPMDRPWGIVDSLHESNVSKELAEQEMGNSVVNKVLTQLYRVPTEHREAVRTEVWGFLCASTDAFQLGTASQYGYVMDVVTEASLLNLRDAFRYAQLHSVEGASKKFKVDTFDLNFLQTKVSLKL